MTDGVEAEIKELTYFFDHREGEPPQGAEHFSLSLQLLIGTVGEDGAESFDIRVCSPSMLTQEFGAWRWKEEEGELLADTGGNVMPVTGFWLMRRWSRKDLEGGIRRVFRASSPAPDWDTLATRIGRLMPWEYDYRLDEEANRRAALPDPTSAWH